MLNNSRSSCCAQFLKSVCLQFLDNCLARVLRIAASNGRAGTNPPPSSLLCAAAETVLGPIHSRPHGLAQAALRQVAAPHHLGLAATAQSSAPAHPNRNHNQNHQYASSNDILCC